MILMKKCSIFSRAKEYHLCRPNCRDSGWKHARRALPGMAMRYLPAVILCLITGLFGSFAHAERPVISLQGGCIAPSTPNENIRLDDMHVTFRSKRDSYTVDARYELYNTGETTIVTVGVPKYGRTDRGEDHHAGEPIVRDFIGFDAWVNGRKTEFVEVRDFFTDPSARPVGGYCRQRNDPTETRWMMKRVTFTGKATTFIRILYEAHYHNRYWTSGQLLDRGYYHDSVGRYWKDKIERASFVTDTAHTNSNTHGIRNDYYGIRRVVAFTNFISVDEIRQWEPSSRSYRIIPGTALAAEWRKKGYNPWMVLIWGIEPGDNQDAAPTPCDIDIGEWGKRVLERSREVDDE